MQALNEVRVAVSLTDSAWSDLLASITRAGAIADIIEIRLDYLKDCDLHLQAEDILRQIVAASSRSLIFTHRSGRPEPAPNRTAQNVSRLMGARKPPMARDYFDFDLRADNTVGFHLYGTYLRLFESCPQIILSYHDFETCNERDLMRVYTRFGTFAPDITKIAAQARRVSDTLAIFNLLNRSRADGRQTIALAMGEPGRITRVLGPSRGSFLTFTALETGAESAPGQFSIDELLSIYRVKSITEQTAVYALLGNPVGHSVSPHMHNAAFAALGIDAVYLPIALETEELQFFIERFARLATRVMKWPFQGASVTVPHKITIAPLLDEIDAAASRIGAVNTIVVREEKLCGYNTDITGAMAPLEQLLDLHGARAAVLGAGGAARSVVAGLTERGASVVVYGRDPVKTWRLASEFNVEGRSLDETGPLQCDILINTTPIGMKGWESEEKMPVRAEALARCGLVYDLVYNPLETELLRTARAAGARTLSGIEMLIAQAAEQFRLWTGVQPPIDVMRAAAFKKLEEI
jgi:3-dehydroquinate dehydratase / shikimate dehydrogenase